MVKSEMVNPPPLAEDTKYLTLPQSLPSREGSISSVPPLKGGKEKAEDITVFYVRSHFQIGIILILFSMTVSSSQVTIVPDGRESSSIAFFNPWSSLANVFLSDISRHTWISCVSPEILSLVKKSTSRPSFVLRYSTSYPPRRRCINTMVSSDWPQLFELRKVMAFKSPVSMVYILAGLISLDFSERLWIGTL